MASVLVIGGQGRIGGRVAFDLLKYTNAQVTVTGRQLSTSEASLPDYAVNESRWTSSTLDLDNREQLTQAIASHDLIIHCAGPFHYRDTRVLKACIDQGVDYLDVSDCAPFTQQALALHDAAQAAGITAIINTGVFPGISNSMVRLCMETFAQKTPQMSAQSSPQQNSQQTERQAKTIRLYYAVAGSGGAGVTVLRTTFLGLQKPFQVWINGQWQQKLPYSDRQVVQFPKPYGKVGLYWYEVPETITLAQSFPVQTVVTKFGSIPDIYNRLTWMVARWFPSSWIQDPSMIESLSQVSYKMTQVSDRFSGTGIAMRVEVTDSVDVAGNDSDRLTTSGSQPQMHAITLTHPDTAIAAGAGTGSLAQLILARRLHQPGVYPVEAALPTALFQEVMTARRIHLTHG
ncbi:MAG: saccharopine dehydrogenase NADP-binding domain-containing protein [Cyanobacteria bacterium P01_F01_bin.150]